VGARGGGSLVHTRSIAKVRPSTCAIVDSKCRPVRATTVLNLREILTLVEGFNSVRKRGSYTIQVWCFNIVVREILTLGEGFNTQRRVSSFPNGQAKGQAYNCMV
jgi:hypothetical protein